MDRIILIETSTALCSTALMEDGAIVSYKESTTPRAHAAMTAAFIKEMLEERGLKVEDCDAVCVSKGPGSYTGLRVGSSTAKGLCFGSGIPLLAVGTLDTLAAQAIAEGLVDKDITSIIPVIDARRMEVYTAVFSTSGERLSEIEPKILDENSFSDVFLKGKALIIGDGASKCSPLFEGKASCVNCCPKASSMAVPAMKAYKEKRFEDTAYFEPFYLKDFVATISNKKLF